MKEIESKMRFLFVTHIEMPGGMGAERRISMFSRALSRRGHSVTITGLKIKDNFKNTLITDCGNNVEIDSVMSSGKGLFRQTRTFLSSRTSVLCSLLKHFVRKWDAVIFYNVGIDSIPAVILSKLLPTKVFTENCDLRYIEDRVELKEILLTAGYHCSEIIINNIANVNITVSTFLEKRIMKISSNKIILIPAIVDTDKYQYDRSGADIFREKHCIKGRRIVLYMGSFRKIEGVRCLIEAFPRVVERMGKDVLLLVAGRVLKSSLHDDVPAIIEESPSKNNIKFIDVIEKEEEVIQMLSSSEVVVVPKLEHDANRAGFPQKVAEILSIGIPLVVSDVGDISKYLKDSESAFFVRPNNIEDLAVKIEIAMTTKELREKVSKNGRRIAIESFGMDAAIRAIEKEMTK